MVENPTTISSNAMPGRLVESSLNPYQVTVKVTATTRNVVLIAHRPATVKVRKKIQGNPSRSSWVSPR